MYCDLHTHSNYSDGTYSPAELVSQARDLGLAIALTDHNTAAGLPSFMEEAEKQGVEAIPGIELSTDYRGKDIHLLGLFVQPEYYLRLELVCETYHVLKERSNIALVQRLSRAGYRIDYEAVKARNATGNVNRALVAAELCTQGYVGSIKEAFSTLLGEEHGFYVPPERFQLTDAIRLLREVKAVPVLAHPLQELGEGELRELIPLAKEAGMLGMEIMHSSFNKEKSALARELAREFDLLPSGGSDFHGANKPDVRLGSGKGDLAIPLEFYHRLRELHRTL